MRLLNWSLVIGHSPPGGRQFSVVPRTLGCPEPQWATRGTANRFIHLTSLRGKYYTDLAGLATPRFKCFDHDA
jgi:hypothetical protein